MSAISETEFLEAAYKDLGYKDVYGDRLLDAVGKPGSESGTTWIEKGDWVALAHEVGAEKIFFLENNPVVVFACLDTQEWERFRRLYNRIWSMARPRLLFFATPGELAVYDLASTPSRDTNDSDRPRPLETAISIAEVSEKLNRFRREAIESGYVFEVEERFGDLRARADKQLIHDLRVVRQKLIDDGLGDANIKYAHALIGRSIFIRYLEDRGVLTEAYFREVAARNRQWSKALDSAPRMPGLELDEAPRMYPRVLASHDYTYALFRRLAHDFNGDMFPGVDEEERVVTQRHLNSVSNLMYGDTGPQNRLFFYAYDFRIVPVELISSIYEEFYSGQTGKAKEHGAYYTPPALAEFVVSQALPTERLAQNPRVMDPACGSGIFLVESFRRIVRYRISKQNRRLRFDELRRIIREQIAGIDLNPEAIRIAAFSLYLAILHYLDPPDIRKQIAKGYRLPNLIVAHNNSKSLNVLLPSNAFDFNYITSDPVLSLLFASECADVVVGNPPWGSPGTRDAEARGHNADALRWADAREYPVGDQERSQVFIWRACDLLKPGGTAALLVSTGVFFKHHENSVRFRRKWLSVSTLESVFNFSHCRQVFFKEAISPFACVVFRQCSPGNDATPVCYWSAKRSKTMEGTQAVVFSGSDLKRIPQDAELENHWTWKALWWGGHHDLALLRLLRAFEPLASFTTPESVGQGFKKANQRSDADWLKNYGALPVSAFGRYGTLDVPRILEEVPVRVERRGVQEVYDGPRILVRRGIDEGSQPKGRVEARFEEDSFCFTNAITGIKLPKRDRDDHKVVLGILWSTLARYFYFMTSSTWGNWHHEIEVNELLSIPIRLPNDGQLKKCILDAVDKLRVFDPPPKNIINRDGVPKAQVTRRRQQLERRLDAAVFELYGLEPTEVDQISDMCDVGIDFYYHREESIAVKPVASDDTFPKSGNCDSAQNDALGDYIRAFIQYWTVYLDPGTELRWSVQVSPNESGMLAAIFTVQSIGDVPAEPGAQDANWAGVLRQLDDAMTTPVSSWIYIEGIARSVSDDRIIIVKRNELRLWTKSMAREDAEATLSIATLV